MAAVRYRSLVEMLRWQEAPSRMRMLVHQNSLSLRSRNHLRSLATLPTIFGIALSAVGLIAQQPWMSWLGLGAIASLATSGAT